MNDSALRRHQIIKNHASRPTPTAVQDAIDLWEQMAKQLISIIGEGGFNSLYARSLFLTQSRYPWLAEHELLSPSDQRFTELKICFEAHTPEISTEANHQFLITFSDVLAVLIGEQLTTHLFVTAWDMDAQDRVNKEFENE